MQLKISLVIAALHVSTSAAAAPPAAHHSKRHTTHPPKTEGQSDKKADAGQSSKPFFEPSETRSTGTVTVAGQPLPFAAVAGTLVVPAKDWEDTDKLEAD